MFKTMKTSTISDPSPSEWHPATLDGGVVYTDLPMNIKDNQSPNQLNMWYKEKVLTKRYGQEIFAILGNLPILEMYKNKFNNKIIIHTGDKLIEIDPNDL